MPNANTQKALARKMNIEKAMPTMFKDKLEVPLFLLGIYIYGKYFHNFLIHVEANCNVMPLTISQRLGVVPQPASRVVIQMEKIEVKVINV